MNRKIISTIILVVGITTVFSPMTFAKSSDYTLEDNEKTYIPQSYVYQTQINSYLYEGQKYKFNGIEDIFTGDDNNLYVCDTNNNVIVKLTMNGDCVKVYDGGDKKLSKPQGVYVDDSGDLFIADTGNNRIVHISSSGVTVEEFLKPDSELLSKDFVFNPKKIYITQTGYMLAIKEQTIMQMDAYGRFRGYIGQPEIGFNFTDLLIRMFASSEQKRFAMKRVAPPYTNFTAGNDGAFYAVSRDNTYGEIKKLNSVGKNIFKQNPSDIDNSLSFITSFISLEDTSELLGERKTDTGQATLPVFTDIAVDENEIITVLDSNIARLYQYDSDGNVLCAFGSKGSQIGKFDSPSSIEVDKDGRIFVSDRNLNNIQIYEPTAFIKQVHNAVVKYQRGQYEESYASWNKVLESDENYRLAHKGLALSLYKRGEYKDSMKEFIDADYRAGYSKAFDKYRYQIFRNNFIVIVLILIALIVLMLLVGKRVRLIAVSGLNAFTYKENDRNKIKNIFKLSLSTLFHPIDAFENIKENRNSNKLTVGIILIALAMTIRIVYIFVVHFPLADVDPKNAMLILEILKSVLPIITWIIATYAVTSIMNGESKFEEIFLCSTFCLVPYILFTLPLGVVSNILSRNEWQFYAIGIISITLWQGVLLFLSLMVLNRYSIKKTILVSTISILMMILIWAVLLLCFALIGQLWSFISGLFAEIQTSFM